MSPCWDSDSAGMSVTANERGMKGLFTRTCRMAQFDRQLPDIKVSQLHSRGATFVMRLGPRPKSHWGLSSNWTENRVKPVWISLNIKLTPSTDIHTLAAAERTSIPLPPRFLLHDCGAFIAFIKARDYIYPASGSHSHREAMDFSRYRSMLLGVWFLLAAGVADATTLNMSHDLVRLRIASQNLTPNERSLDARPLIQAAIQYIQTHPVQTLPVS